MSILSQSTSDLVTFRTALKCDLDRVRDAVDLAREFLEEQGVSQEDINACGLALSEASNNAVQYVTPGGLEKNIHITVICRADEVECSVLDHTAGFIWTEHRELPPEESEGGRGLYLIQNLMDYAEYVPGENGNSLIMRKYRSQLRPTNRAERGLKVSSPGGLSSMQDMGLDGFMKNMRDRSIPGAEQLFAFLSRQQKQKVENLREHIRRMLEDMLKIVSADWYVLRVVEQKRILQLFLTSDPQALLTPIIHDRLSIPQGVEEQCFQEKRVVQIQFPKTMSSTDPLCFFRRSQSIVASPLMMGEQLLGTLTVGRYQSANSFTALNAEMLRTFVDFLSIQFVGAEMTNFADPSEQHELEVARCLQQAILPRNLPHIQGFSMAGFCHSAKYVGGDFYDVIPLGESTFIVVIADVMGKGIPAAMYAAIMRSVIRAMIHSAASPSQLLAQVNDVLYEILSSLEIFITAQVIYLDSRNGECVIASAGHCPCLICRSGEAEILSPDGMPLGIFPNVSFQETKLTLTPEIQILLYTDGLTEAKSPDGAVFGQERLIECLENIWCKKMPAQQSIMMIKRELTQFQESTPNVDDQTMLILSGVIKSSL